MNKRTVDKIHATAAGARGTLNAFLANLSEPEKALFCKYFHLRPGLKTVTIVSTLDYAPMRRLELKLPKLRGALDSLWKSMSVLTGADPAAAQDCLKKLGFRKGKKKNAHMDALHASFIRGMMVGQKVYGGVRFICSGLPLAKKAPFAVVGYREHTLFIFTLCDKLDPAALTQAEICRTLVLDASHDGKDRLRYDKVFRDYPGVSFDGFDSVACVAVLNGASVSPDVRSLWAAEHNPGRVQLWFFEEGLAFAEI